MTDQSGDMTAAFASALDSAGTSAAEASPASTPATAPAPSASTPAAATVQPEAQTQTTESVNTETQKKAGEPPTWRWQDILANTRKEVSAEAEQRVRQEYQWAQGITPEDRAILFDALKAYRQTPAPSPQADPMPEPDLDAGNGWLIYSAAQQQKRDEWRDRQLLAKLAEQYSPLQQTVQTLQQREQKAQAFSEVSHALATFKAAHPDFDRHKGDLHATIASDPALSNLADRDPALALELAYARVFQTKVLPAQQKASEATVLANLQQRAVASTVNPSAASATEPKTFRTGVDGFAEALAHFDGSR